MYLNEHKKIMTMRKMVKILNNNIAHSYLKFSTEVKLLNITFFVSCLSQFLFSQPSTLLG